MYSHITSHAIRFLVGARAGMVAAGMLVKHWSVVVVVVELELCAGRSAADVMTI